MKKSSTKMIYKLFQLAREIFQNFFSNANVVMITESADWVINGICKDTKRLLKEKLSIRITNWHYGIRNSIIHFGSINTYINSKGIKKVHKSNKIVVSWFHVAPNDERIKFIKDAVDKVSIWHTSCTLTKNELVALGIPCEKIVIVPIGADLDSFKLVRDKVKQKLKAIFKISNDAVVIGSFQKDGNGWGQGNEPKLVKGPDVFCDVIEKVSKEIDIHVLLTGPARGYVKNRLEKAGIPYTHKFLDDYLDIVEYYNVLDLYLITSRTEGGPRAIAESFASGVPIVSTRVGMAPDCIVEGENGMLCEIGDVECLARKALMVVENNELSEKLIQNGLEFARELDIKIIGERYYEEIYKNFI